MIRFENVTARYTQETGIFDLSFAVAKGELVFLMGPTGAGKSTVLRAIIRDIPIEKGIITIDKTDVTKLKQRKLPSYRRNIGMIFQDFKLIKGMTVYENISLPLRIVGLSKKMIKDRVTKVIELVGLKGKENSLSMRLSGGEQQRVSIARALVTEPGIILADEPTGNLDPIVSDDIIDILQSTADKGTTVIMSTHNYPLIRPRKKRFIELNDGRLIHQ